MKVFRFIGSVIIAVLMFVGFSSCDKDDDEVKESFSIVGSWKTQDGDATEIWSFWVCNLNCVTL